VYLSKLGYPYIRTIGDFMENDSDYVRATEPLEVTFTPLSDEVIVEGRVKSLDAEIEKTRAEMSLKINDLKDQKQRLLAITHQEDE
jgi:hypothetical protein